MDVALSLSYWTLGAALVLGGAQYYGSECGLICCTLHDAIDTYYWHIGAVLVDKWGGALNAGSSCGMVSYNLYELSSAYYWGIGAELVLR